MKLTFRFIFTILLTVVLVTAGFTILQLRTERARLMEEINTRAAMVAASLQAVVQPVLADNRTSELSQVVERFSQAGPLVGTAVYNRRGKPIVISSGLRDWLPSPNPIVVSAISKR